MAEGGQANQNIFLEMRLDERGSLGSSGRWQPDIKSGETATHNINLALST